LASLVLETISTVHFDSHIGIAFVYFSFIRTGAAQNVTKILATIIKQLARQKNAIPEELRQFCRKHYRDADSPNAEQLEARLSELMGTFDQVYLVIDALDEFDDRGGFLPIISGFVQGSDPSIKLKVFVTSRREKDIVVHLTKPGFPTIQIEAQKVDADIAAFVHHQVGQWDESVAGFPIDQKLKGEIIHALSTKSNGM